MTKNKAKLRSIQIKFKFKETLETFIQAYRITTIKISTSFFIGLA